MRAADVSNWTGPITDAHLACLRRQGIELLICGTQIPALTRQQLAAAGRAGLLVEAYVILRWDRAVVPQVRAARAAIDGAPVRRLWVDCEQYLSLPTPPPSETLRLIGEAVAACEGIACGIYTRRSWWSAATGDARGFAGRGLPLWDARYVRRDGDPIPPFVPYGGWMHAAITQWHDSTELCGLTVCLDEAHEEVSEMTAREYDELKTETAALREAVGALLRHEGALGAKCDANARELRRLLALIVDGRAAEAKQRLRFEMTAAAEPWPALSDE